MGKIMEKKNNKKTSLGRGLTALLAETSNKNSTNASKTYEPNQEFYVPIEKIEPNNQQPRKNFDQSKLDELSKSIIENGIIQPLIVRKTGSKMQIVAGERRWRAAQLARLHEVPIIVKNLSDQQVMEYAIVENIQREDLNPIEEALSYKFLMENFEHTQEELSSSLGKSRSHIANLVRLLNLPKVILDFIKTGKISVGHARALIGVEGSISLAMEIIKNDYSVRETEKLIRKMKIKSEYRNEVKLSIKKDINTLNLEKNLSAQTKFPVKIENSSDNQGKVIIYYKNLKELDQICEFIYSK